MNTPPTELDAAVRGACARGELEQAATLIVRTLGADVVRVLHARFAHGDTTAEVFSRFAEDLWSGLADFQFRCSVRAWVFTLARNAGNRYLDRELRQRRRERPLSSVPELFAEVARVRTQTMEHLPTNAVDELASLRAELDQDDQLLLTLRVDRALEFAEIACVMLGDPQADAADVTREAARVRKRFQLLKERLRKRWHELRAARG